MYLSVKFFIYILGPEDLPQFTVELLPIKYISSSKYHESKVYLMNLNYQHSLFDSLH